MASITRDVIMTFRGQNYLSSAIRRVGRDVGGLSRIKTLQMSQAQNAVNLRRLATQKASLVAEQQSMQFGSRALTMDLRRAGLKDAEISRLRTLHGIENRRFGVSQAMLNNENKLFQIQAAAQHRFKGGAAGMKLAFPSDVALTEEQRAAVRAEYLAAQANIPTKLPPLKSLDPRYQFADYERLRKMYSAEISEAVRLRGVMGTINEGQAQYNQLLAKTGLEEQKVTAQLREEAIALRLKGEAIETINIAEIKQIEQQSQLMMQARALPTEKWIQYSQAIEHTGRVMQMFGLIATAVLGYAAKQAADFQSQAALAATQARPPHAGVGATARIQQQVTQATLNLMQQFPASASDQLNSFYEIFSGTNIQNTKQAAAALKVFNEMAVAGGTDLKSMTQVGITLMNTFPQEFKNMTNAGDEFFKVVRYGRITADQLGSSLGYITPIARMVGLTFKDVGESLAFLTRQTGGQMIRTDAQGLARMVQLFGRADVEAGLAAKGIDVFNKNTGNMRNPIQIIAEIHDKLKMTRQELENFFKTTSAAGSGKSGTQGTIQAIRTFGQFYESISKALDLQKQIRADNHELQKSYETMSKSAGVSLQVFLNRLKTVGLIIGNAVIPIFEKLSRPLEWIASGFNKLGGHAQHVIGLIAGITAVTTLLVGAFLMFTGAVASMLGRLRLFIGYMKEGQGLFGKLGYSALGADEQLKITNATLVNTNEQLAIMKQLIMDIATGAPIGQELSTGIMTPTNVILPPGVQREAEMAQRRQQAERLQTATTEERLTPKSRRSFFASARGEGGVARVGPALGLGTAALMAWPIADSMIPQVHQLDKALGGLNNVLVTTAGFMAAIWIKGKWERITEFTSKIGALARGFVMMGRAALAAGYASAKGAVTSMVAWVKSFTTQKAESTATAVAVEADAAAMETANVAAADATTAAWTAAAAMEALATLGISVLIAGIVIAASYAITHWSKVRRWFGEFWGWMKKIGKAVFEAYIQYLKAIAYAIFTYFVTPFKLVLEALSHLPGFLGGHKFQDALNAINEVQSKLAPNIHKVGQAYRDEAAAQKKAAEETAKHNNLLKQQADDLKNLHHFQQQVTKENFKHQVQRASRRIQHDPSLLSQIRDYQKLHAEAIAATDPNKMIALATRAYKLQDKILLGKSPAMAKAIKQALAEPFVPQQAMSRTAQEWISKMVAAKKYMDAHPYDIAAAQKFEALQNQLNDAFKNQPSELAAINDVLGQYNNNLKTTTKNGTAAAVTMSQMQSAVQSMYDTLLQQNQSNMGQLFGGPVLQGGFMQAAESFGYKPQPRDYLRDIKGQLFQFNEFNRLINRLRREGAPEAMIQQLLQMGPSALPQIRALVNMSKPQIRQYFGVFQRQQEAIHRATMAQLNSQLSDYLKYGRKVGLAMAAGIRSETPAIQKAIRQAILNTFGHLPSGTSAPPGHGVRPGTQHHVHTHHHEHHTNDGSQAAQTRARHARFKSRSKHNHPELQGGGRN